MIARWHRFRRWMGTWQEARQAPESLARYGLGLLASGVAIGAVAAMPLIVVSVFWPLLGIDPNPNPIGLGLLMMASIPIVWPLMGFGAVLLIVAGIWSGLRVR